MGEASGTPAVSLRGLSKHFGEVRAVDGLDLDVAEGEFFSMLGPSGSGKTTVLRLIAGFEAPTAGSITLGGTDVTRAAPFERDVTTVFQDYALFPHMSVLDNVAYGLRVRGVGRTERRERAAEALGTVALNGMEKRSPTQLSGGQRQRVALARALVVDPQVLLLDEPLGALDLKLREQMQVELKQIQRRVGITFVFVTHDQEEALTLSDRVAVFNQGRDRAGRPGRATSTSTPRPASSPDFVGTSNLFEGRAAEQVLGRAGRVRGPPRSSARPRQRGGSARAPTSGLRASSPRWCTPAPSPASSSTSTAGPRVVVASTQPRDLGPRPAARGQDLVVGFDTAGVLARRRGGPARSGLVLEHEQDHPTTTEGVGMNLSARRCHTDRSGGGEGARRAVAARRGGDAQRLRLQHHGRWHVRQRGLQGARRAAGRVGGTRARARSASSRGPATPRTARTTRASTG